MLINLPVCFSQDYYQQHLFPNISRDRIILVGSVAASLYFLLGAVTGRFADFAGYRISLILGSAMMIGKKILVVISISHGLR